MATALIVIGSMMLIALVIRFIQPELIYSIRQALVEIRTNKALLDYQSGRSGAGRIFADQLIKDLRYETRDYDEERVLWRVNKIRELYRLLDPRRKPFGERSAPRESVCIVELAEMLKNIGMHVVPRVEFARAVVGANGVLAFLANRVRETESLPALEKDHEIQHWFSEHPISVEQTVELLIAVVFALAYRQSAARRDAGSTTDITSDHWPAIIKLERRLRWLVRRNYESRYNDALSAHKRMSELMGDKDYQDCLRRMQHSRQRSTSLAIDFVDFLYMKQLPKLILDEWGLFREVFNEKDWLKLRLDYLLPVRNDAAHGRPVNREVSSRAVQFCAEIEKRIDDYLGKTGETKYIK